MSTLFDYILWRGDLTFENDKFNEIDNMILNMILYVDLGSVLKESEKRSPITLREIADRYYSVEENSEKSLGLIMPSSKIHRLFREASECRRFADIEMTEYISDTSIEGVYQFCGATFNLKNGEILVAFRGTDDSIVGWREDFTLSFMDEIPSQKKAVEYLDRAARKNIGKQIYVGGHSKGGNLAVYSAVNSKPSTRKRIIYAYSNDGPGFSSEMVNSKKYLEMAPKIFLLVPQSSLVGVMFDNGKSFEIVKSKYYGLLQHDGFSWELEGPKFVKLSRLSNRGEKNEAEFKRKMKNMSLEERKKFVETFFGLLEKTGATTLSELSESKLKSISSILKSLTEFEKEEREMMQSIIMKLISSEKE